MRSIAMASYNGMPYIKEQIASIVSQLAADDELVISDNGSTDGTARFIEEQAAKDPRIRLFCFDGAKGVVPNFENALRECRGTLLFLSDQDDIWLPGHMDRMTQFFDTDPGLMAVQANAEWIDGEGNRLGTNFFEYRRSGPGILKNFYKNTWQGCNMAFRRTVLDAALPFPKKIPMHDMWIGILSEMTGRVLFLAEILSIYRRHDRNVSGVSRSPWYRVAGFRIRLAAALILRYPRARRIAVLLKSGKV